MWEMFTKNKMKKREEIKIIGDVYYCNICNEKMAEGSSFNMKRIEIIRGLFKNDDFHAHEVCVNSVIKQAFSIFINN